MTYADDTHIFNKWQYAHKFRTQELAPEDEIVLYTKKGKNSAENLSNNRKRYTYLLGAG